MGPSVGGVGASLGSLTVENKRGKLRILATPCFFAQVEPPCSASLRSSSSSLAKSEASGLSDSPVPSYALKSNVRLGSATNNKKVSPLFGQKSCCSCSPPMFHFGGSSSKFPPILS